MKIENKQITAFGKTGWVQVVTYTPLEKCRRIFYQKIDYRTALPRHMSLRESGTSPITREMMLAISALPKMRKKKKNEQI